MPTVDSSFGIKRYRSVCMCGKHILITTFQLNSCITICRSINNEDDSKLARDFQKLDATNKRFTYMISDAHVIWKWQLSLSSLTSHFHKPTRKHLEYFFHSSSQQQTLVIKRNLLTRWIDSPVDESSSWYFLRIIKHFVCQTCRLEFGNYKRLRDKRGYKEECSLPRNNSAPPKLLKQSHWCR